MSWADRLFRRRKTGSTEESVSEPPPDEAPVLAANLRPPGPRFDDLGEPVRAVTLPDQRGTQRTVFHIWCDGSTCSHE
jgi:hypothetical protein